MYNKDEDKLEGAFLAFDQPCDVLRVMQLDLQRIYLPEDCIERATKLFEDFAPEYVVDILPSTLKHGITADSLYPEAKKAYDARKEKEFNDKQSLEEDMRKDAIRKTYY